MREATPRPVDDALRALVRDQLVRASLPLAGLMAFFAVADRFTNPSPAEWSVTAFDAAAAVLLVGAWAALRVDGPFSRSPNAVAAVVASFLAADALHDAWLLGQPVQATYLMLVAIGVGALVLSRAALLLVVFLSFAGYVAVSRPGADWTLVGLALFAACVLSVLIH
ncbi:MAG TPA: hypothetical protein VHH36_01495, partial [Candidatus Thermoplasmatota archaeon]|nr:hypothetical protein [Candidatus Thermoplasmatota archaeon]